MNAEHVKAVAIKMVEEAGLINLTRAGLCERAGVPDGSFPHVVGCTFTEFVHMLQAEGYASGAIAVTKSRANPELRKEQILGIALELATEHGYHKVTRDQIAKAAGVSMGLVSHYIGTMTQFRRTLMRAAIKQEVAEVVAQGLALGDEHARKAPAELKARAAELIANA